MLGPLDIALDVVEILDEFAIQYVLGGSLASSTFGEPRATNDVDLAIRISPTELDPLLMRLCTNGFHVPERLAADAAAKRASFNVVHPSGLKVDLFVLGQGLLDRLQMDRRVLVEIAGDPPTEIWVTSPADQVLRKLDWYRDLISTWKS